MLVRSLESGKLDELVGRPIVRESREMGPVRRRESRPGVRRGGEGGESRSRVRTELVAVRVGRE